MKPEIEAIECRTNQIRDARIRAAFQDLQALLKLLHEHTRQEMAKMRGEIAKITNRGA